MGGNVLEQMENKIKDVHNSTATIEQEQIQSKTTEMLRCGKSQKVEKSWQFQKGRGYFDFLTFFLTNNSQSKQSRVVENIKFIEGCDKRHVIFVVSLTVKRYR